MTSTKKLSSEKRVDGTGIVALLTHKNVAAEDQDGLSPAAVYDQNLV